MRTEDEKRNLTKVYVEHLELQTHQMNQFVRINKLQNPLLAGFKITPVPEMKAKVNAELFSTKD